VSVSNGKYHLRTSLTTTHAATVTTLSCVRFTNHKQANSYSVVQPWNKIWPAPEFVSILSHILIIGRDVCASDELCPLAIKEMQFLLAAEKNTRKPTFTCIHYELRLRCSDILMKAEFWDYCYFIWDFTPTLKMEAVRSFEMLVTNHQMTWCNNP